MTSEQRENRRSVSGELGMELPDTTPNRQRWAEAAPKLAMALSEAGYPTTLRPYSFITHRENELEFTEFPPAEVLLHAAELCDVTDLMQEALVNDVPLWRGEFSEQTQ